ncbi:enoyl-CoA hydratase-related protein [Parasphingopyxis marina]|uniref:Enoyl-CoA hydratase/isomerase family protein n=1 Tax=Parasphingopyxis marina TaxID=2761622 RepID=A0A842I2L1_9SPHN|nr:enoyl-CoA hydratase-related protein [Parasphingopyxis marina]MBC2778979.1 enoyl-CoA hydratase/isomerase family protein [Parasphingopyxis marina]
MTTALPLPECRDSTLDIEDGVATLHLCRDDVRNILTGTALIDDIIATCNWASEDERVGALVITGDGRAFSAGGNIKNMAEKTGMFGGEPAEIRNAYRRGIQEMSRAVYRVEVPVVAAVNGAAIGAGLDLACMCDIRLGSTRAKVAESFVTLGIVPGDGGAWFLPRVIGPQRAAEMTYSGRIVEAAEAHEFGLFMELCEPETLAGRAQSLAASFARQPPRALRLAKQLLRLSGHTPLDDFLDHCASLQALAHHGSEHDAAVAAAVAALSSKTR